MCEKDVMAIYLIVVDIILVWVKVLDWFISTSISRTFITLAEIDANVTC